MTPAPGYMPLIELIDAACSIAKSNDPRSSVRLVVSGENSVDIVLPWFLLRQMVDCWQDIYHGKIVSAPEEGCDPEDAPAPGSTWTWVEGCDLKP